MQWVTIRVRGDVYKLLKVMSEVEHRSIANMAQECIIYYFTKKHKELDVEKVLGSIKEGVSETI